MKQVRSLATAVAIVTIGVVPVAAQGRSGHAKAPKTSEASKPGGGPKAQTPASGGSSTGGAPATSGAPTITSSGNSQGNGHGASPNSGPSKGNASNSNSSRKSPGTTAANTTSAPAPQGVGGTTTSETGGTTSTSNGTSPSGPLAPPPVSPNGVAAKIARNPNQLARINAMLPQGMTLEDASAGFRNQGQFIATLNASKRTGVPFTDLKTAMTVDGLSLGQAVKHLQVVPPAPASPATTTGAAGSPTGTTTSGSGNTVGGTTTTGTSTTGLTTPSTGTSTTSTNASSTQPKS